MTLTLAKFKRIPCNDCAGRGYRFVPDGHGTLHINWTETCPECGRENAVYFDYRKPCEKCFGRGFVLKLDEESIEISQEVANVG